jgi:hypothetical protein
MSRLRQLMMNDEGFIFDPSTGESFTVNGTGLFILKALKEGKPLDTLVADLRENFEIDADEIERDVNDFINHLRIHNLL